MQQHGRKYFGRRPPTTDPGDGINRSVGQNLTFSEHGHISIKENQECSNMVANILAATPPPPYPDPGVNRLKFNFSEHGR